MRATPPFRNPVHMDTYSCKTRDGSDQGMVASSDVLGESQRKHPQCQPPSKKRAKRRFHVARPYQERVTDMARARQEVVNALKLHRAAMKARERLQCRRPPVPPVPSSASRVPEEEPNRAPQYEIYPLDSSSKSVSKCLENPFLEVHCLFLQPNQSHAPWNSGKTSNNFETISSVESSPRMHLNHQMSRNTTIRDATSNSLTHSISSPVSSSWPCSKPTSLPASKAQMLPGMQVESSNALHLAMNAKEIDEIRLIGAKHDMEWNDELNLSVSLWWCDFLQRLEAFSKEQGEELGGEGDELELVHSTAQHSPSFSSKEELSGNGSGLPCVTTEEIEGTGTGQLFPY